MPGYRGACGGRRKIREGSKMQEVGGVMLLCSVVGTLEGEELWQMLYGVGSAIREGWGTVSSAVVGLRTVELWQRNGVKWAFEI